MGGNEGCWLRGGSGSSWGVAGGSLCLGVMTGSDTSRSALFLRAARLF